MRLISSVRGFRGPRARSSTEKRMLVCVYVCFHCLQSRRTPEERKRQVREAEEDLLTQEREYEHKKLMRHLTHVVHVTDGRHSCTKPGMKVASYSTLIVAGNKNGMCGRRQFRFVLFFVVSV